VATSLYTFVDLYSRALTTLDHLLDKGAAFAAEKGVAEAEMLDWRLIDDMAPLRFQAMVVVNFAQSWTSRVAGLEVPADIAQDLDVAGFKAAIAKAKAYLGSLTAEQFAGRDDVPLTHQIGTGMTPTLPSGQWLTVFATTNLYFHLSIAYAILRARGVPIGKIDLFAAGL
jgi:hypothetical protein